MKDYEQMTETEWAATWAVEQAASVYAEARQHERGTRPSAEAREQLTVAATALAQAQEDYRMATGQEYQD